MHRLPFPDSKSRTHAIDELIHVDLCGPMETRSIGESRYYLLLKGDYSYFQTVYFIENKARCVENFIKRTEKQCPRGVKILRTDNGLEFVNREMQKLTHQHGIRHQRTVAYISGQNDSAERDCTLMETARAILNGRRFEPRRSTLSTLSSVS